jgi:glycosyltransferase 2 family protein
VWQTIVESARRVGTAQPAYVAAALGLYIVSLFISGARWRGFIGSMGGNVGVLRASLAMLGGIAAGNLTPSSRIAGEVCRIALVQQSGRVTWKQATVAAIWDRLSEVPPILVLAVMSVLALRRLGAAWKVIAVAAAIGAALVAGAFAIGRLRRSPAQLSGWRDRLSLDRIHVGVFAAGVGYSSLLWLQDVLRLTCAALAFGVSLSPTQVAMLSVFTMLGGLVPSFGGLGPVEGSLMAGLVALGADVPTAAAVTAVERFVSYGFSTIAGSVVVALLGGRSLWRAVRRRSATTEPDSTGSDVPTGGPFGDARLPARVPGEDCGQSRDDTFGR